MYLSAIETLICHTEIAVDKVYFLRFAQNTLRDVQNMVLNSYCHCLRQMPQKLPKSNSFDLGQPGRLCRLTCIGTLHRAWLNRFVKKKKVFFGEKYHLTGKIRSNFRQHGLRSLILIYTL